MTPWVTRIIAANVVMYVLTAASPELERQLMFVPALVFVRPWTLFTYMFLHAGIGHILFNMLGLFFFGPRLEMELGPKHFLWLYVVSGLSGAALSFFFSPTAAIVGASAAVYGVLLGFAYLWPRAVIHIWGVFPVEARWFVLGLTALSLFSGFGGGGDGIAHFAHLGGFLGGFIYLRSVRPRHTREIAVEQNRPPAVSAETVRRWREIDTGGMHEVNREEFQRIMGKIDAGGVETLTADEVSFLERFSAR